MGFRRKVHGTGGCRGQSHFLAESELENHKSAWTQKNFLSQGTRETIPIDIICTTFLEAKISTAVACLQLTAHKVESGH
jgi:hypothetical protein